MRQNLKRFFSSDLRKIIANKHCQSCWSDKNTFSDFTALFLNLPIVNVTNGGAFEFVFVHHHDSGWRILCFDHPPLCPLGPLYSFYCVLWSTFIKHQELLRMQKTKLFGRVLHSSPMLCIYLRLKMKRRLVSVSGTSGVMD